MSTHGDLMSHGNLMSHGDLAELFGLLGDSTRLRIVLLLAKGPRNVSSLCDSLLLPQPTISHHLALLRRMGMILNRREGKQVFYSLNGYADGTDHNLQITTSQFRIQVQSNGSDMTPATAAVR